MIRILIALFTVSTMSAFATEPTPVSHQATMVPTFVPGTGGKSIRGFRIADLESDSVYAKIGLKKGDIIKTVNGEKVDSPDKAMALYNSLQKNKITNIVVERDGKEQELNLPQSKN